MGARGGLLGFPGDWGGIPVNLGSFWVVPGGVLLGLGGACVKFPEDLGASVGVSHLGCPIGVSHLGCARGVSHWGVPGGL